MSFSNPIIEAGVAGLCDLYADRAVTPVEACEAYLSRIDRLDGALGAYVFVDREGALAAAHESAERWRNGAALSLLDGQPIAVKANIAVEGLPWHAGIGAYRDRIAGADASAVARLREGGAVILGVLNMSEGGFGGSMDNPWFGRTHNPWLHDHIPGSSSGGGAAAVAAGLCAAALGTDTLGSVRGPSALSGVFGHKPTLGLIPTDGVVGLSWTLDHVGVHGRSADDCARLLAGASGAETELAEEISQPAVLATLREAPIGALQWAGVEVEWEVMDAYQTTLDAARAAGLTVEPVVLEDYDFADRSQLFLLCAAEAMVEHAEMLAEDPKGFSAAFRARLALGMDKTAADLAAAYRELAVAAESVRAQLCGFTGLLMPATPVATRPFEAEHPAMTQFTALANVLGLPATVFPVGLDQRGRPLAAQALAWEDDTALGLARLLGRNLGAPPSFHG
ncbi:MAG TPA: amidase [Caulobacteraceae bacterium]|jgi:aspartyl-tRNA(Asn)/glutamyl-tRNA(Gln) amidotransferase subunit A|nr:amidase [Caulobacteraceae bacterium]